MFVSLFLCWRVKNCIFKTENGHHENCNLNWFFASNKHIDKFSYRKLIMIAGTFITHIDRDIDGKIYSIIHSSIWKQEVEYCYFFFNSLNLNFNNTVNLEVIISIRELLQILDVKSLSLSRRHTLGEEKV